ncbi:MAG: hypothetical protein NTW08_05180 [Gammaproteobacteria bacterium]|nr:hypothetical protein [Gammaproteobacteria bacterium]
MTLIKASFKGNPPEERKQFANSSCLMPISVGQRVHEGEKLASVIKLVSTAFQTCTILVDDSIQRYTLAIERLSEPDLLYDEALMLGRAWLMRNQDIISQLSIPYQVLRWDDWLKHAAFQAQHERVSQLYHHNSMYKAAIHQNVDAFLARDVGRNPMCDSKRARIEQLCVDYLLEECAVMCLWTYGKYHFELYPTGRNQAMTATYEMLIKPQYSDYLRSVGIRFKKYPIPSLESSTAVL